MSTSQGKIVAEKQATSTPTSRARGSTVTSIAQSVQSAADIVSDVLNKDPPPGFFAAAAGTASTAPTVGEIRRGSLGTRGFNIRPRQNSQITNTNDILNEGQVAQSNSEVRELPATTRGARNKSEPLSALHDVGEEHPTSTATPTEPFPDFGSREDALGKRTTLPQIATTETIETTRSRTTIPSAQAGETSSSGDDIPPAVPWATTFAVGLQAILRWVLTPFGFFWTLYGLNVVAWGGMLFLLLVNAAPAMCWAPTPESAPSGQPSPVSSLRMISKAPRRFDCNDIFSPRRIWLEIDSQILNALFCVTGFGLAPWRFRDLWYLLRFRLTSSRRHGMEKKLYGLRKLAGIYRNWFRLPGSDTLDVSIISVVEDKRLTLDDKATTDFPPPPSAVTAEHGAGELRVPLPITKTPTDPATGVRAPPTAVWKMDLFVWCQIGNTAFQVVLCGFMWEMTRYNRPSWATGLFIALACIIAGVGGIVAYIEGGRVKRIEGLPKKTDVESIRV